MSQKTWHCFHRKMLELQESLTKTFCKENVMHHFKNAFEFVEFFIDS